MSKYISTIGIDYGVKPVTINGQSVRINFWDLSGHPDFFEIRNEFYKDSQGVSNTKDERVPSQHGVLLRQLEDRNIVVPYATPEHPLCRLLGHKEDGK